MPILTGQYLTPARLNAIVQRAAKTGDETVNNSAALQDDNDLQIAVLANTVYRWSAFVIFTSGTIPDFKMDLSLPSGATHTSVAMTWNSTAALGTQAADQRIWRNTDVLGIPGQGTTLATQAQLIEIHGTIVIGATAGTAKLRWAQNTANVSDTKVCAGSWLELGKASA